MHSSPLFCTNCGAANRTQAAFCFACGRPLQAPGAETFITADSSTAPTGLLASAQLLKDRYRILSQLGSGGMGAVYKAEDTLFQNRLVAVKEMSQSGLNAQQHADAASDFKREAYMLAGLQHPSLPTIHDYFSDGGQWYLVMDFIEGQTLEAHLSTAKDGWLPIKQALDIGIQLCTVLHYLHTQQPPIVFRDLKPANVMLTPGERIFLIDFGIARHFKPGQLKDTVSFGSAGYAAPEQYGKTQTTPRSDIYSLGVILHQCLTGNDPASNSPTPFNFPPLDLHDQPAPAGLETLIMHMLRMDPATRPPDMADVREQLRDIAMQQDVMDMRSWRAHLKQAAAQPPIPQKPAASSAPAAAPNLAPRIPDRPKVAQTSTSVSSPVPKTKPAATAAPYDLRPRYPEPNIIGVYHGHSSPVLAIACSPDRKRAASGDSAGKVHIWDTNDRSLIYTYGSHPSAINTLAWSPNGKHIALGDADGLIEVWNATTTRIYTYRGYRVKITSIAWSPDGTRIVWGDSAGRVQVQDALNGDHSRIHYQNSPVLAVAWSPDGGYIAAGDNEGKVHVYDARSGLRVYTAQNHRAKVQAIVWSPDSKRAASGDSAGKVHVYDALDGGSLCTYSGHTDEVSALAWSPSGASIASGSTDATVHIWDASDGGHAYICRPHTGRVSAVAWLFSYNSRIVSASADTTVKIWEKK